MKKTYLIIGMMILTVLLCSCKQDDIQPLHIGLVSSHNTVNDHSFNEAAWNAVLDVADKHNIQANYSVSLSEDIESYSAAVSDLYNTGCRMIIVSDYKLAATIEDAQKEYRDCLFVCIGFTLSEIKSNTLCISFSEHEAAFLAGVAAALQLENGNFGGVLGMDIPSSQRYINGFKNGLTYANRYLNTSVSFNDDNIVFIGSYNDSTLAETVAKNMYLSGVNCIFSDGGNTGIGVFNVSKSISESGERVWVIGAGTDNYYNGIYNESGDSVTLTSAVYNMNSVVEYAVQSYYNDSFSGGKLINFSAVQDGIGIPINNTNINNDINQKCTELLQKIKNGEIVLTDPANLLN